MKITAQYLPLRDLIEAHTHLTFSGGPILSELKHKLKHRESLTPDVVKRAHDTLSWAIRLDQDWDPREEIVMFK